MVKRPCADIFRAEIACHPGVLAQVSRARMRISAIVPVLDGGNDLRSCLQALRGSCRVPDEIIVVDDGSRDGSDGAARALGARVLGIADGPRGPAYARNRGAELATGDVLVFVDADVALHADALARMASVFAEHPEVAALFGSYDDAPPAPGLASRYKNLQHHFVHQHGERDAGTFWAGCGAVRAEVFRAVGGFDESYREPSIEDIELGLRLKQAGHRIRLCPEVQAAHLKHWTLASLWRTDIRSRALPWTRLILRQPHVPTDLNLGWRSRLSALAAWLMLGSTAFLPVLLAAGWPTGAACSAVLLLASAMATGALNAELYGFFLRKGGAGFAAGAALLHVVYLLYSSAVFVALCARHKGRFGVRSSGDQATE